MKAKVVKVVMIISFLSLTLQLVHYFSMVNLETAVKTRKEALNIFLNLTESKEWGLFLIDPDIVSLNILNNNNTTMINNRNNITLGINGSSQIKVNLFDHLSVQGFQVYCSEIISVVNLTFSVRSGQPLPAHFLIYHQATNFLIHVVVFYKRYSNFIWCDRIQKNGLSLKQDNLSWLKTTMFNNLHFGKVPLSFNSINTTMGTIENAKLLIPENGMQFLKDYQEPQFIECNYTRAEQFYKENKISKKPPRWAPSALKMLVKTREALDQHGIPFTIAEGTLLGWYRQCGIMSYTTDIDILVFRDDYSDTILGSLKAIGFSHIHTFGQLNNSLEYSFKWLGVKMDMFFVYKEKDLFWIGATDGKNKFRFNLPKFTNCWSELLGVRVRVPCDAAAYIIKSYGKNWYIPLKRWWFNIDAPNFKVVGK